MGVRTIAGNAGPQLSVSAASTSYYRHPGLANSPTSFEPAEADISHTFGHAGQVSDLTTVVAANGRGTATEVLLRKNGADTDLAITVAAAATGLQANHTDRFNVAPGDTVSICYRTGTGTGTFALAGGTLFAFDAANDRPVTILGTLGSGNFNAGLLGLSGSGITQYVRPFVGFANLANTAADNEDGIPFLGGVISYFQVRVSSNTRTGDLTFTLQKNGVDTTATITVPAGQTGAFVNTGALVSFAADDEFVIKVDMAASTGSASVVCTSLEIEWDSDAGFVVFNENKIPGFDAWGTNNYVNAAGGSGTDQTTAAARQVAWPVAQDLIGMACENASTTGDTTETVNINGVDGNLTITVPASDPGLIWTDTTHTDSLAQDDLVCVHHVRSGLSTNGYGYIKWLVDDTGYTLSEAFCWFDVTGGGTLWTPLRTGADDVVTDGAGTVIIVGNVS